MKEYWNVFVQEIDQEGAIVMATTEGCDAALMIADSYRMQGMTAWVCKEVSDA